MSVAPDGSPVDVYLRLPDRGEGELVAAALPPPASLLELGCPTGRVTRQLVARGYSVVAVDESAPSLRASARHGDLLVVETLPLGWRPPPSVRVETVEDGVVHGEVFYEGGFSHAFAMRVFADEDELGDALGEWRLERWLDRGRGWFTAVRAPP